MARGLCKGPSCNNTLAAWEPACHDEAYGGCSVQCSALLVASAHSTALDRSLSALQYYVYAFWFPDWKVYCIVLHCMGAV